MLVGASSPRRRPYSPMLLHPRLLPAGCASTPLLVNPPPSRVTTVNTVECLNVWIACPMPWPVAGYTEDKARKGIMTIPVRRKERRSVNLEEIEMSM
jgi:hypothetical protein